jgi:hypothetical protein
MAISTTRVVCLLCVVLAGCKTNNLAPTPISTTATQNPVLSLTVLQDSAAADGVLVNKLAFSGGQHGTSFYSSVTFTISPVGVFSNGSTTQTLAIDVNGQATAFVSSQTAGTSTVVATVNGATVQTSTTFVMAWPDQINIQADSTFLMPLPGTSTNVTATLVRNSGKVSLGEYVSFSDSTAVDSTIGVFGKPALSDASGLVTTTYTEQDSSYHGFVYLIGKVMTSSGQVEGRGQIKIR